VKRAVVLAVSIPVALLVLLAGLALLAWLALHGGRPTPRDAVFHGGPVLTMDAESRVVEAIAIRDGRILAVGDASPLIAEGRARGAEIVDLAGRAIVPGFVDAHGHYPGEGMTAVFADLNSPPIGPVEEVADALAALERAAARTDAGAWVIGIGFDDTLIAEERLLDRHDLDGVSTAHPVAVLHISGHLASLNSRALETLGYGPDTEDPVGGTIRREADGRTPDGVLEESAMEPVQAVALPGPRQALAMFERANARALAHGVTTVQSGFADPGLMRVFIWLHRLDLIPLRLIVYPDWTAAEAVLGGASSWPETDPDWLAIGPVKLIADGSIQGYTGYLSTPYHVPPGDDPDYRGYPRIPRETLMEQVERLHAAGEQIAVHGNGDASIDDILDAFEAAARRHPRTDARPIVIHAQMARDDQLDRMAALGVVPSFFSLHTFYWGDRHAARFMGPERAARMSPAASAHAKGVRFTIHCDAPVVPMEPLRLVWSAVNRRTRSGRVIGAEERITPMQALRAVTIDAAWQHFLEDSRGSLEPGKLADLVVLERPPLDDPATIDRIAVEETILGGATVFQRGVVAGPAARR
jgi:predicted amidohydrolase YtcJ